MSPKFTAAKCFLWASASWLRLIFRSNLTKGNRSSNFLWLGKWDEKVAQKEDVACERKSSKLIYLCPGQFFHHSVSVTQRKVKKNLQPETETKPNLFRFQWQFEDNHYAWLRGDQGTHRRRVVCSEGVTALCARSWLSPCELCFD